MTEQKAEKEKLLPRLRRKYPWFDHVIRANDAFSERYGNHYAAAITYFSVLSLFPLLMVGFSVAGFILAGNEAALRELRDGIISSAPEGLGDFLATIVDAALDSRAGVGVLGLLLAFYSGLGWMTNLRDALTAQWGQEKRQLPFLSTKVKDLVALVGLGLALAVSFGLTAVGGGVGNFLLELVGLDDAAWARFLLRLATIVLALAANVLVFLWVISQLPREKVSVRSAVKGAVLAAVGFEVLKQVATVYLASVTSSPSGALFGPIIGLLVFANLVSRFLLFVTAWTATARENVVRRVAPPPPAVIRPNVQVQRGAGAGLAAGAFGAGALLGWLGRRRR
ncbi:inner membrane protein YhjD [Prauserella sp. PE36]|uniref:Inner membrane protein YhjD n=1 Tax=Prauserella endophytica TaxID=1592324 RepID=A0ABY2RUR1_9PSEU|nr:MULTISPECIES: inner membrane protein YhjD [Prauserella]PXY17268.1 inner membrane protein YhjD [Prauserella coralliicola]RBM11399.1 inner membrane protein YhjD [Prauserella sp. PE36]TKG59468.1 inner membrane protein YhjD [Prauserella endophytica]